MEDKNIQPDSNRGILQVADEVRKNSQLPPGMVEILIRKARRQAANPQAGCWLMIIASNFGETEANLLSTAGFTKIVFVNNRQDMLDQSAFFMEAQAIGAGGFHRNPNIPLKAAIIIERDLARSISTDSDLAEIYGSASPYGDSIDETVFGLED